MSQERINALLRRLREAGITESDIELRLLGTDAQRRDLMRRERSLKIADIAQDVNLSRPEKVRLIQRLFDIGQARAYALLEASNETYSKLESVMGCSNSRSKNL
jgi:hypothetical protein